MILDTQFDVGDHVAWKSGRAQTTGYVLRRATCRVGVSGKIFDASPNAPRILVRRDDDGELAVLSPGALHLLPH